MNSVLNVDAKSFSKGATFLPCLENKAPQLALKKFQVLRIESGRIAADLRASMESVCLTIAGSIRLLRNLLSSHSCRVHAIPFNKLLLSIVLFSFPYRYAAKFHSFSPPSRIAVQ